MHGVAFLGFLTKECIPRPVLKIGITREVLVLNASTSGSGGLWLGTRIFLCRYCTETPKVAVGIVHYSLKVPAVQARVTGRIIIGS
jgi:hypothetical protein